MITHPKLSVKLDTISEADTDLLRKWRNSPEIYKWSRQNDLLTESQHKGWMQTHPQNKSVRMYLIRNAEDKPVGVCGLSDIDLINQRAEFSIYIAPNHQGCGYGSEALKLLCHHSFLSYPLNIIWGECFSENPAIKIFKSVGFKEDGKRRNFYYRDGKHIDSVMISMHRKELVI